MEELPDPAEQPWYIRMIAPAPPVQKDVDFSDPKEASINTQPQKQKISSSKQEKRWSKENLNEKS